MNMTYQGQPPQVIKTPAYGNNMIANRSVIGAQTPTQPAYRRPTPIRTIYAQKTTKNKSFLDMHHYLKAIGVKNNEFMLTLIDPDLDGIDPHDPHLNAYYKQKVLRECMCNYWYFIREVVRIPSSGGKPMMYKLTRGNLALSFCQCLNLNVFYEAPRLNLIVLCSNT